MLSSLCRYGFLLVMSNVCTKGENIWPEIWPKRVNWTLIKTPKTWPDESKVEGYGHNSKKCEPAQHCSAQKNTTSTTNQGGGGILLWSHFSSVGTVAFIKMEEAVNSSK